MSMLRFESGRRPLAPVVRAVKPAQVTCIRSDDGAEKHTIVDAKGIGSATITPAMGTNKLTLVIKLKGLEKLQIANAERKLTCSVASHSGHARSVQLDDGVPIDSSHALWTSVRAFDADGAEISDGLPGDGGWFEVDVPAAMLVGDVFDDREPALKIEWVDFFR